MTHIEFWNQGYEFKLKIFEKWLKTKKVTQISASLPVSDVTGICKKKSWSSQ